MLTLKEFAPVFYSSLFSSNWSYSIQNIWNLSISHVDEQLHKLTIFIWLIIYLR